MNYLAHACLSFGKPAYLVGNFLGDFVKNKDLEQLTPEVVLGVKLHRTIDVFTDTHPLMREANRLLYPAHSKYAGILMDIFCDYLLAKTWDTFYQEPLRGYIDHAYSTYNKHKHLMTNGVGERMQAMVADDWLWQYRGIPGIEKTLYFLSRRVSKPLLLEGALNTLQKEEHRIQELFVEFFPQAMAHAHDFILQNEAKS
jgi:acyl carrier protein phosphodiesterase